MGQLFAIIIGMELKKNFEKIFMFGVKIFVWVYVKGVHNLNRMKFCRGVKQEPIFLEKIWVNVFINLLVVCI